MTTQTTTNFNNATLDTLRTLRDNLDVEIQSREQEENIKEQRLIDARAGTGYYEACEHMKIAYIIFKRARNKYELDEEQYREMVDGATEYAEKNSNG